MRTGSWSFLLYYEEVRELNFRLVLNFQIERAAARLFVIFCPVSESTEGPVDARRSVTCCLASRILR